ncbi:reverse transcriptase domain-containing protein [Microbispora sp. H10949]|uniref:reverse transcriptase domain-containing protein n=1 Tax=Microbispora sp. H10949 TaxID=2729111 RepID=UPI002175A8BD|nr:reverse transcriptase domain-containing protein [Microbispora sp. H10949]
MSADHGPERGRRSAFLGPRVLECKPLTDGESGIVPAAQVTPSVLPQSHSLMPFLGERHLAAALRQCGRRRSSTGGDGMTWADYRRTAAVRIPRLARALREGTWLPGPLRVNPIPTYCGKQLPCVIPTVEDRLVHRAMRNAVEPVLEAHVFADWVSGYRPGRNRLTALRQSMAFVEQGFTWVADVDVAHVSQGSDPEQVTGWLAAHVHDGAFLDRFRTALAGLPSPLAPGTGVSPLLINLRLSRADRLLPELRLVRFADNYCAFTASRTEAERAMERVVDALDAIGMTANAAKSRVRENACVEDLFLIAG